MGDGGGSASGFLRKGREGGNDGEESHDVQARPAQSHRDHGEAGLLVGPRVDGNEDEDGGADDRARSKMREEQNAILEKYQQERARQAHIEPKEYWTEDEIKQYDGRASNPDGPILLAADGIVFNVWKGRQFYMEGGEYHIFAGRDATRLLARTLVEEESIEDSKKPLTMAERAALAGWIWTFKNKYDIVGKLHNYDPTTTSMS